MEARHPPHYTYRNAPRCTPPHSCECTTPSTSNGERAAAAVARAHNPSDGGGFRTLRNDESSHPRSPFLASRSASPAAVAPRAAVPAPRAAVALPQWRSFSDVVEKDVVVPETVDTLEWVLDSPPPLHQFEESPIVVEVAVS